MVRFSRPSPARPKSKGNNAPNQSSDNSRFPCAFGPLETPPDLATVIDAWSTLPEPIKAGIMALVRASSAGHPSTKSEDPKSNRSQALGDNRIVKGPV